MCKLYFVFLIIPFVMMSFAKAGQLSQVSEDARLPMQHHVISDVSQPIPTPIMNANMAHYAHFLEEKGGNPLVIDDFASVHSNRVVVDMVLLQQALLLGGANIQLQFYGRPNPSRAELDVKQGVSPILGYETWKSNFDDTVYMSDLVVAKGEFLKVVVGRHDNGKGLMQVTGLADLQELTAVTGHRWSIDIATLREMGIKEITTAPKYALQITMLQERRADFGLYEYTNVINDMPSDLAVVPGLTVGLNESRHFMVSKSHPAGKTLFEALQKGIKILKSQQAFKKAYRGCGFISNELESWQRIFP